MATKGEALTGRDLDLEVALRVMGWHEPVQWCDDEFGRDPYAFEADADPAHIAANDQNHNCLIPLYSTDKARAEEVRGHIEARGGFLDVPDNADPEDICHAALRVCAASTAPT